MISLLYFNCWISVLNENETVTGISYSEKSDIQSRKV